MKILLNLILFFSLFSCGNEKSVNPVTPEFNKAESSSNETSNESKSDKLNVSVRREKISKEDLDKEINSENKSESYNETVLRILDENLETSKPSFKIDTSYSLFTIIKDEFNTHKEPHFKSDTYTEFNRELIEVLKLQSFERDYRVQLQSVSSFENAKILYSKSEGGHADDSIDFVSLDKSNNHIYNLPLFYDFKKDGYSIVIESTFSEDKIIRTVTEEIGWRAVGRDGHFVIPKSITTQSYSIQSNGLLELLSEEIVNRDFEVYRELHIDIECNEWNSSADLLEYHKDSIGWYKSENGIWQDSIRGQEFKFNMWPPLNQEKYYYSNITSYIRFPLDSIIAEPKKLLRFMLKDSAQNLVKWVYPLEDSKLLQGKNYLNAKVRNNGMRSISVLSDDGKLNYTCYQYGDLIFVNVVTDSIDEDDLTVPDGERMVYNMKGEIVYQEISLMPNSKASCSFDARFVSFINGGISTEDGYLFPTEIVLYDLELQKYIIREQSNTKCFKSGLNKDSAWFTLTIGGCKNQHADDIYMANLTDGRIYKLNVKEVSHFNFKVCPDFELTAVGKKIRQPVFLDRDFTELDSWPF